MKQQMIKSKMNTTNDMNVVCFKIMPKLGPFKSFIPGKI